MTKISNNATPVSNKPARLPDPRITDPAGPVIAKDTFVGGTPIKADAKAQGKIGLRDAWHNTLKWGAATVAGLTAGTVGFLGPIAALEFTIGPVAAAPILGWLVPLTATVFLAGAGYLAYRAVENKLRSR